MVSTQYTTAVPKVGVSVVPKVVPPSVVPKVTVRPQTSYTVVSPTASPKPIFVSTKSPLTVTASSPVSLLSSQPGVLSGGQLPDFIPVSTAAPGSGEISHSLGASGFKGVQLVKAQPNPKHRQRKPVLTKVPAQVTSPPLFGGFSSNNNNNHITPERPKRPEKPQPVYKPTVGPTYKPVPVVVTSTPIPTPTYDPFSFQTTATSPVKTRGRQIEEKIQDELNVKNLQNEIMSSIRTVTPQSLGYEEESTIVPVYLTSDLPELRRVPKNSASGGPPPTLSTAENEIIDR